MKEEKANLCSSGNIVGVVISQLNKRTFGSLVENVNFGVKASTVR